MSNIVALNHHEVAAVAGGAADEESTNALLGLGRSLCVAAGGMAGAGVAAYLLFMPNDVEYRRLNFWGKLGVLKSEAIAVFLHAALGNLAGKFMGWSISHTLAWIIESGKDQD